MSGFDTFAETKRDDNRQRILRSAPQILGGSYLKQIIPRKGWRIHEDYVDVLDNNSVMAPVIVYANFGKARELPPQWGVYFIRDLVSDSISATGNASFLSVSFINSVRIFSSEWVKKHQDNADKYSDKNGRGNRGRAHVRTEQEDLAEIASELDANSTYLGVGFKYNVAAIDLEHLDDFLIELQRRLDQNIPGIMIALPNGDVDQEFGRLFSKSMDEPGRKFMFTSQEYAGFYNFVTQGIEDPNGVYVGEQWGDINDTAVLWDMTRFSHHAVLATSNRFARKRDYIAGHVPEEYVDYTGCDLWLNTLILQLVREHQGRVFTLALDPFHLSDRLNTVTSTINMNKGSINPFEMFGDVGDEQEIFAANQDKWKAMTRQLAEQTISSKNVIEQDQITTTELTDLVEILQEFYHDRKMWPDNPSENRDQIRIINVPHNEVPRLNLFIGYLETAFRRYSRPVTGVPTKAAEVNKLLAIFKGLQTANSDLFDTATDPMFDALGTSRHTLLDYSRLKKRKGNILLVQLLNSISAIANQTADGDTLIIHGAQHIVNLTQGYIKQILEDLYQRNVRVVFSYASPDAMLEQADFNKMSSSDWTLTGHLTPDQIAEYNKLLGNQRQLTDSIKTGIQAKAADRYYLRRVQENGVQDNIVFDANPLF